MNPIPYGRQNINQDDIDEVIKVLKSDYLTQGPNLNLFEKKYYPTRILYQNDLLLTHYQKL